MNALYLSQENYGIYYLYNLNSVNFFSGFSGIFGYFVLKLEIAGIFRILKIVEKIPEMINAKTNKMFS